MCGISIICHTALGSALREPIERMVKSLLHRGPDDNGTYIRRGVALGHTRLSIVDEHHGKQPMHSVNGRYVIVYNGELYNYRKLKKELESRGHTFKTDSDTEVVLTLFVHYGEECLAHMRGMFSFAVLDKESDRLFFARDRLGIKPLFYSWDGISLVAASEMKAIFSSGYVDAKLNIASIKNYFSYQFSIAPNTPFEGLYELPPGHYMTLVPKGNLRIVRYWDLEFPRVHEYETQSEEYWRDNLDSALRNAVKSHTIGDFPVGSYLSGGIDSCAVSEMLKSSLPQSLQTFSIGFNDQDHDESWAYREVARYLGVENRELKFSTDGGERIMSLFTECLYHLEQPQRLSVDIPHYLLSGMVQQHDYKVVFTGDGADEILAGYDCFRQDYMRVQSNTFIGSLLRKRRYLKGYTEYFSREYMQLLLRLHSRENQKKVINRFGFYPAWYDFWQINAHETRGLFLDEENIDAGFDPQMLQLVDGVRTSLNGRDPLNQSLYLETKTRLPGWILWKSDRLSMAHGVEARVPFMDHTLVELAARIPPRLKLNGMEEKYLLKEVMKSRLPELAHNYKKRGFYAPIRDWFFVAQRRDEVEPYLSRSALEESGIFEHRRVNDIYSKLLSMEKPNDMQSYYQCMRMEWVLLSVLSVQILHQLFVKKQAKCFSTSQHDLVRSERCIA